MDRLKKDWRAATIKERARFIVVLLGMLIAGGYGIYSAVLLSLSVANKNADFFLLIPIALLVAITWLLAQIPLNPKGRDIVD